MTHYLYLHGFQSGPQSLKAQETRAYLHAIAPDATFDSPQLSPYPAQAMAQMTQYLSAVKQPVVLIGSSLGGFYATVLAEHSGCRAVVINPAVFPARDLARYIGEQTSWHDPQDRFFFRPEFIAELDDLHPAALTRPERYFALIATGDEVLDWREMRDRYAACPMQVIEGSDHALSDFETWLPQVMRFIGG